MRTGPTVAVALVGVLVVALVAGSGGATALESGTATADAGNNMAPSIESCAADSPEDFGAPAGGDAIGYVDGYWYDEPIVLPAADDGTVETNDTDPSGADTDDGGNETTVDTNGTDTDGNDTDEGGNETDAGTNETNGGGENATSNDSTDAKPTNSTNQFDATDGLNDRELEAVVARTAARVETVRCLSFASVPTVRLENRSTVRATQHDAIADRPVSAERFDDARLSTALLLGDATSANEARARTTASATLGYYDPATDSIVVVVDNGTASNVDEATLAHELVHALQTRHFELDRFDASRTDAALAESALIEGDASLVAHQYRIHCADGDWASDCFEGQSTAGTNSEYLGLQLLLYQPYNEGGAYAEALYAEGGWAAVNDRYDDPPTSTKELLYPTTSTAFEPATVSFQPVTDPAWQRVDPGGQSDFDVLGPGTIGAAMIAPTFDAETDNIYSAQHVTNNVDQSTLDPLEPYDYAVDATAGWEGGQLEVYSNEANQTAARWRTEWESATAAATFRERYVQLLDTRGAASSRNFVGTYHFPPEHGYDGRYAIRQNGSTVTIVQGPNLTAVRALDPLAAREPSEGSSSSMTSLGTSKRVAEDALSGPGGLGAAIGILVAIGLIGVVAARRR
ncbi:hypothetical protein L593_10805 [Salinarchaeum sp. Harcht-Bsk1]|uniref:Hvo_1808 family surface protein n=1 Tax=Salinarchaeum sp. Harcht-Bsk1 TaxID=1333523 RepID=UPI0003422F10|nr:Hvo_1808 family surface protein [Salinarchaeum sp. Harcht-Bsk1]AGN02106.1 hypothetical protein L593_10805 [Salinarchaeum sp. Harcht-Bsk1]